MVEFENVQRSFVGLCDAQGKTPQMEDVTFDFTAIEVLLYARGFVATITNCRRKYRRFRVKTASWWAPEQRNPFFSPTPHETTLIFMCERKREALAAAAGYQQIGQVRWH
ncbi:hypothetical protein GR268_46710, partial [Rhizobium leguminosarum]|nr:hypothetical protein [Rhizobium leguminosarum]